MKTTSYTYAKNPASVGLEPFLSKRALYLTYVHIKRALGAWKEPYTHEKNPI